MDAAATIKTREAQLCQTTRHLRTKVAKFFEVDRGDFPTFIVNCNKFIISV